MQPAKYLEVLNLNDQRVAYLAPDPDGVQKAILSRQKNSQVTLKFILPRTSEKWVYIDGLHKIKVNGHIFWIVSTEEERDSQGRLLSNVQCEEIWVKDLGKQRLNYISVEILSSTAQQVLDSLLTGTGWSTGSVTVTGVHDLESEKESCLWNIQKVQELWGGVLVFDSVAKTISLYDESTYGVNNGVQIRYGKNQKSIKRTVDYDVVTRLIPFGKDCLNISTAPGQSGNIYIENFQYTTEILEGVWENQEYDTASELKAAGEKQLAILSRPRANYAVNLVDLSALTGYEIEAFDLYHWLTMFDPDICPNGTLSQIYKYDYDVFDPQDAEVELGDAQETLADILASHSRAAELVTKVASPNPTFQNILRGVLNTYYTQINGSNGKFELVDGVATWIEVDGQGAETGKRLRITPAGLGISSDGGQTYSTAVTGAGIATSLLTAGEILTSLIKIVSGDGGHTSLDNWALRVFDGIVQKNLLTVNQATVESNTLGFTALLNAALSRDTTQYQAGTASLKCITPNVAAGEGFKINYIDAYAAQKYSGSIHLKGNAGGETLYMRLRARDKTGADLGASADTACTLTTAWQQFSVEGYTTPANTARLEIEVVTQTQQAATFFYDTGQLEMSEAKTDYAAPSNLRVVLGQIASGKFGLKIIDGEMYGTYFKTGLESDTSGYIEIKDMGSYGLLKLVGSSGNEVLSMASSGDQGTVRFSDNGTLKGMVLTGATTAGELLIMSLDSNGVSIVADSGESIKLGPTGSDTSAVGVAISGGINSNLNPVTDINYTCGSSSKRWTLVRGYAVQSGDLCWEETECAICGERFVDGDILAMLVKTINEEYGTMTVPVHDSCKKLSRTVEIQVPEMVTKYRLNDRGEKESYKDIAFNESVEEVFALHPDVELDENTGQYKRKLNDWNLQLFSEEEIKSGVVMSEKSALVKNTAIKRSIRFKTMEINVGLPLK